MDTVQRGAYRPLSLTLFIYATAEALQRPALAEFVKFYLDQDPALIRQVGGIPTSARA